MTNRLSTYSLFLLLFLSSCSNKRSNVSFYSSYNGNTNVADTAELDDLEEAETEDNIVAVPFQVRNGVKTISVTINDVIGVDMIVDTGCSGALISVSEARYLAEKGALTIDDVVGTNHSVIADGSIVEDMVVHLNKLTIGGKLTATDVTATVSKNIQAPLLLGNEILNRVKAIGIDNEKQLILFQLY